MNFLLFLGPIIGVSIAIIATIVVIVVVATVAGTEEDGDEE